MQILEVEKTQWGRLWSILVALLIIIIALQPELSKTARIFLIIGGFLTILTASIAYFENYRRKSEVAG